MHFILKCCAKVKQRYHRYLLQIYYLHYDKYCNISSIHLEQFCIIQEGQFTTYLQEDKIRHACTHCSILANLRYSKKSFKFQFLSLLPGSKVWSPLLDLEWVLDIPNNEGKIEHCAHYWVLTTYKHGSYLSILQHTQSIFLLYLGSLSSTEAEQENLPLIYFSKGKSQKKEVEEARRGLEKVSCWLGFFQVLISVHSVPHYCRLFRKNELEFLLFVRSIGSDIKQPCKKYFAISFYPL